MKIPSSDDSEHLFVILYRDGSFRNGHHRGVSHHKTRTDHREQFLDFVCELSVPSGEQDGVDGGQDVQNPHRQVGAHIVTVRVIYRGFQLVSVDVSTQTRPQRNLDK